MIMLTRKDFGWSFGEKNLQINVGSLGNHTAIAKLPHGAHAVPVKLHGY